MTLEFNYADYSILDAALTNRIERIQEMMKIFNETGQDKMTKLYDQELHDTKTLKLKISDIFNTEF
jgi:hypothetical protein